MKLVTFSKDGNIGAGFIDDDQIVVCAEGDGAAYAVRALIEAGSPGIQAWQAMGAGGAPRVPISDVTLLSPVPDPRRDIFCVGKNYFAHAKEFHSSGFDSSGKEAVPSAPIIFTKATTSIVGPEAVVRGSLDPTATVDYEGELGVIIGTRAFQVAKDKAYDHVFGYVVINDVTSRELQRRHNQWVIGKGIDTFCPMGPYIVTADEVGDVSKLKLETEINGEIRQKASVADLIFDIPTLIETISATMTLLPGDIIATGTPEGVGIGFNPPKYLTEGDHMTVRITGLGELHNVIG
ncbi:2-keto-4-pentenoate hydratase/2-oxohepta-3-ene-1,7-dioic acid hydratase [Hoeflea sp. IMCC20628]|uniref:fumarylacetoacetate hydrolase family protein n=1 Tax=Hoeflea sp. IMCC20628 TaxID=1620421 RepID=UPI00063B064B|nr:fumarylacetoacetate hydrolase family protein [Hoeflea sp. IMCC20628]AKH98879.1 2-keto-4-pentenoate hydratase/2-oxohepta-3-ene-1,7-dioic acid hydratase [Hoeflea sp. IMCC20628]